MVEGIQLNTELNKFGRCSFGSSCKYEHRCSYCFKFGHTVINCRRLKANQDDKNTKFDRKDHYDEYNRFDRHDNDKRSLGQHHQTGHSSKK